MEPSNMNVESFRNFVNSSDNPIFYYTPLLYDWIPEEEIKKTIRDLKFSDDVLATVGKFLDENELRQGYYGIHLRMTDFVNIESFDVDHWIQTVQTFLSREVRRLDNCEVLGAFCYRHHCQPNSRSLLTSNP